MKTILSCSFFLVLYFLCSLFDDTRAGVSGSITASEQQGEAISQDIHLPPKTVTNAPLNLDKYTFSNLSEFEQDQIRQEVAETNDASPDQLIYEFRAKQEEIRFYEVILLAVMSLCALAIVLKYMKDSKACHACDMLNGTGLVLVIFATVLVIIIANVESQLTAAMGVLGGIAGYLFGTLRSSQTASSGPKTTEPTLEKKS